jgi:hypothetical protein
MLKEIDRIRLQGDLELVMNLKDDQAILIDLGADEIKVRKTVFVLGQAMPETESNIKVI